MFQYKQSVQYTLQNDLCVGCGICEDICPSKAISTIIHNGRLLPTINVSLCKNEKGCHRCMDSCPGIGCDLVHKASDLFQSVSIIEHRYIGKYLKCFSGYSTEETIRLKASSGGVLTHFLIWLLENKKIDGAVVTKFAKNEPLYVKTFIATTKEEIIASMGSKYAPVSYHETITNIKSAKGSRYVIIGLPCHIHGFRKVLEFDKQFRQKIVGLFSLFCSGTQTFNYTEYIVRCLGGTIEKLDYLAYREGNPSGMVVYGNDFAFLKEYEKYNLPLKSTFYPRRCLLCVDMFGELADLSFGDIHTDIKEEAGDGISAIIARSQQWLGLLLNAKSDGALFLNEITVDRLLQRRKMAKIKKTRNASFVALLKNVHRVVPEYGSSYNTKVKINIALRYTIMRIKQFIGSHKKLWFLLPKIQ